MELPFTIVFEPPSQAELRALLRMRGYWVAGSIVALTIGTAYLIATVAHADVAAHVTPVALAVRSQAIRAEVSIDGRAQGTTPLDLTVEPGTHNVSMRARGAQDSQYTVDVGAEGAALDAVLWRTRPQLTRLRPMLPGASLADVRLLRDGLLGMSLSVPPGRQLQAWRFDPHDGASEPLLTHVAGARLAFAPDGRRLAFIGADEGPPAPGASSMSSQFSDAEPPLSVAWIADEAPSSTPSRAWRAPLQPREQLVDISWSPLADHLLVVSKQPLAGESTASHAWLISADGRQAEPVLSLPSEVLPGSEVWSPDGRAVLFVAHAGQVNALCLLQMDGTFRYIADLELSSVPPPGDPPVAWSADGQQLVFVAPHQHPPGVPFGWLQPESQRALYLARLDQPTPRIIADTEVQRAWWREDGQFLGLGRAAPEAPLNVRLLDRSGGAGQQLLELPLRPPGAYAATWDLGHAQLVVAVQTASGGIDYWLVRLGLEAAW